MTGPADRILDPQYGPITDSGHDSKSRTTTTGSRSRFGLRPTRRDVFALILGAAVACAVERRSAFAQEDGSSEEEPPDSENAEAPSGTSRLEDGAPSSEAATIPPVSPKTYTVQAGDTLYSIARKHGVTVDAVLWANNLTDANVVRQGQQLVIPPSTGKLHTVKDGDTLEALAKSYGVSKTGIAAVNGLDEDASLKAGQRLLIPVTVRPSSEDPAFTPAPLVAASVEEPIPIPEDAGTGSPTPPTASALSALHRVPGIMTATGTPSVTVTNRKVPKLQWPVSVNAPKSGVSQKFRPGHTGVDIYSPAGTPIKAAAGGVVKLAEKNPDGLSGYGWIIIVDHGDGIATWYAHCGSFSVEKGDKVKAGDKLGTVGMTGRTTGPHLHFELRVRTSAVDPLLALS